MKINNKKGFSLVELSIVLIIVALLISGVISGKSLINNSKMNVLNSELNTFKIAFRTYIDNNGIITYKTEGNNAITFLKLIDEGYLDANSNVSSDTDCYPSKSSGNCWYYDYDAGTEAFTFTLAAPSGKSAASLDTTMCKQFKNRFEVAGESGSTDDIVTITCSGDAATPAKKSTAIINIYDIFY